MFNKIKKHSILFLSTLLVLSGILFVNYNEFVKLESREEDVVQRAESSKARLNSIIYHTLKSEAQVKVNDIAKDIKRDMVEVYKDGGYEGFARDFENHLQDGNTLIGIFDKNINHRKYFYVENDSNDMFVTSKDEILFDTSGDCAVTLDENDIEGTRRYFHNEIPFHFNIKLAKRAFNGLQEGRNNHLYWEFLPFGKEPLKPMQIDSLLKLSYEDLRGVEFLTYAYIDRERDLAGNPVVFNHGELNQSHMRLTVVQGFNLYDQIQDRYSHYYVEIDNELEIEMVNLKNEKIRILTETVFVILLILMNLLLTANTIHQLIVDRNNRL